MVNKKKAGFYASPGGMSQSFLVEKSAFAGFFSWERGARGPSCPNSGKYMGKGNVGVSIMPELRKIHGER
jgi:hypothetical protein